MLTTMIVAAALAGAREIGEDKYTFCLKHYAVKYGASNTETVDTILRIARGECSIFMTAVEKDDADNRTYKRVTGVSLGLEKERVIERAEGAATKALLEARTSAKP